MKQLKQYELPAYWATCLVNRDFEHANEQDAIEAKAWLDINPNSDIVSCSDNSYIGRYAGLMCDMLTYYSLEG